MGNESQVARKCALKWDIVEASFQVQHAGPLSTPELRLVLHHIVELVLVLSHLFVDWDDVLVHQ